MGFGWFGSRDAGRTRVYERDGELGSKRA